MSEQQQHTAQHILPIIPKLRNNTFNTTMFPMRVIDRMMHPPWCFPSNNLNATEMMRNFLLLLLLLLLFLRLDHRWISFWEKIHFIMTPFVFHCLIPKLASFSFKFQAFGSKQNKTPQNQTQINNKNDLWSQSGKDRAWITVITII